MLGLEFASFEMLRFLRISRLAVIDSVEVEFGPGLNVLTGETGAGKSILVEAVGLLLGGRASPDLVRTGEDTATVEAVFESGDDEILVRRELTASGRSRAYVNGALVTATALKDLASRLVELHGQHEHHILLDPSTHRAVLDAFGAHDQLVRQTQEAFVALDALRTEIVGLRHRSADREARLESARFQLSEIEKVAPAGESEDADLAAVRQLLASADRVERLCRESYAALYEDERSVLGSLGAVWRRVEELAAIDPQFQSHVDARAGIKAQLEDLAAVLRRYADGIDVSPVRLQQVEERLATLERLKRRYGPALADVVRKRARLRTEIAELDGGEARLGALETAAVKARARYLEAARALSQARQLAAGRFTTGLVSQLGELAMEQTRFEARVRSEQADEAQWTAAGLDDVEFYISPNPGEDLRPLARIVSGGELSRVMLAIKTLTATGRLGFSQDRDRPPSGSAPGLVFDEIDAGIGGRVADVVGLKLRTLGSAFQVLCITHQPRIAARGDAHFLIDKTVEDGRTRTRVVRLSGEGRADEIARMLGGATITPAIRASARELLGGRPGADGRGAKGESERAKGTRGAQVSH
jgi:DNA repair protein RecN (Recombination protein N)